MRQVCAEPRLFPIYPLDNPETGHCRSAGGGPAVRHVLRLCPHCLLQVLPGPDSKLPGPCSIHRAQHKSRPQQGPTTAQGALHSLRKHLPRICGPGEKQERQLQPPLLRRPASAYLQPQSPAPLSPVLPPVIWGGGGGGGVQCKVKMWVLLFKNDQECSAGDDLLLGPGVFPGQS